MGNSSSRRSTAEKTQIQHSQDTPNRVVAIDFGTYTCGFALQHRADYETNCLETIQVPVGLSSKDPFVSTKTRSCILLRPDKSVHMFGFDADFEFNRIESLKKDDKPDDWQDWYFFKHFKMRLYTDDKLGLETPIEAANNKFLPAVEIISITIKYLKQKAIEMIQNAGFTYEDEDTKWVVTVPAIWRDAAKNVMHEAAEKAGINGKNLTLALEPECAALYISKIPLDKMSITNANGEPVTLNRAGQIFMVVDVGGGTVEITTFQTNEDETIQHLQKSGGGASGGGVVNAEFEEYMVNLIGQDIMQTFAKDHPIECHDLQIAIELCKQRIDDTTQPIAIQVPNALVRLWEKKKNKCVDDILRDASDGQIEFRSSRLWFNRQIVEGFFVRTINCILGNVNEMLDVLKRERDIQPDCLLIVGGVAESTYLIKRIREKMREHGIPVVRPCSPEKAVLIGAVLFGHNEAMIKSRVMRYTYGIGMTMEFNPKIHKEGEKYNVDGKIMANNVFRKHVTVGDSVKTGEWIASKEYFPESDEATSVTIYIFISDKKNPIHTTETGCEYLGCVDIEFRKNVKGEQIGVVVEFNFGGTELRVRAVGNDMYVKYLKIK